MSSRVIGHLDCGRELGWATGRHWIRSMTISAQQAALSRYDAEVRRLRALSVEAFDAVINDLASAEPASRKTTPEVMWVELKVLSDPTAF